MQSVLRAVITKLAIENSENKKWRKKIYRVILQLSNYKHFTKVC